MEKYTYKTQGVCAREITFEVENGRVYNVSFMGGCNGNLRAISKLVEGLEIDTVIAKLDGNICGTKNTSCADQLCRALKGTK